MNMKISLITTCLCIIIQLSTSVVCTAQTNDSDNSKFPVLTGKYLGQKPPGIIAEKFAEGIIPNEQIKALGVSFTPEADELYFSSWRKNPRAVIMYMKIDNGKWTAPEIMEFSRDYMCWDLNLSPDGKKMVFSSKMPLEGTEETKDGNIWMIEKDGNGNWGKPQYLSSIVNTSEDEVHPTIAENGNIYFFAGYDGGIGSADIYCTEFVDGEYAKPVNVGKGANSRDSELDPFIAPDESYMIFHSRKPGGYGENDLYITFRNEAGKWSDAVNMGENVNSEFTDYCGRVTSDGKYLIFSRKVEGKTLFFWVSAEVIEHLRINREQ